MIKILSIQISNFRSYKNTENVLKNLNLMNSFVGKNNVGKTNILRAIYLFFNPSKYNAESDRNIIKQITGGASKEPKITIEFSDDELNKPKLKKYKIICDLNKKKKDFYVLDSRSTDNDIKESFSTNQKIKNYFFKKFKCVYLSTTDNDISTESNQLLKDMILQYFKKKSKKVKNTIDEFESQYKSLINSFEDSVNDIEKDLSNQFKVLNDIDLQIKPKLKIMQSKKITDFLLENIDLQLDDTYTQDINNKGAGIQRSSLILLSLFLLNEIYSNKNKLILLDEPEAFLYPLLVDKIKTVLEDTINGNNNFQVFLTTHSREFLKEINDSKYKFFNIEMKSEEKKYERSKKDIDTNKYSLIQEFDNRTKYIVLKNYGLLDEVDNFENIIICEGATDKNYLLRILKNSNIYVQIRYEKCSEGLGYQNGLKLNYNYMGRGASSALPILSYLENISDVKRKVFVLLDGDEEGVSVSGKIVPKEYKNLTIQKYCISNNREIEDVVFSKEDFINEVLNISPGIKNVENKFKDAMSKLTDEEPYIQHLEDFIKLYKIPNINIKNIKHQLSINLEHKNIQSDWILEKLKKFFN